MLLSDFSVVIRQLHDLFEKGAVIPRHEEIVALIRDAAGAGNADIQEKIQAKIAELETGASQYDVDIKNYPGVTRFLDELGLSDLNSGSIAAYVRQIISTDPYSAATLMQARIDKLNVQRGAINNIASGMDQLDIHQSILDDEDGEQEALLNFSFQGITQVSTIAELDIESKKIRAHLKSLSRLEQKMPAEAPIVALSKSSPFLVTLGISLYLFGKVNKLVGEVLDNIIKVQKIQKTRLELKKDKLLLKEAEDALVKNEQSLHEDFIENTARRLYSEAKPPEANGAEEEIVKGLKDAIKWLHHFLQEGGDVDVLSLTKETPLGSTTPAPTAEVRSLAKQMNTIVGEVKALQDGIEEDVAEEVPEEPEASASEPDTTPSDS